MLYSSSEFRNKEKRGRVCVPRATVRLWQKEEAVPPKLKRLRATVEGPFCAGVA